MRCAIWYHLFKKREKPLWWSVTLSKVAGFSLKSIPEKWDPGP